MDAFLHAYVSEGATVVYTIKATESSQILDGRFAVHNSDGLTVVEGTYSNGVWHGDMIFYHGNGQLSSRQSYHLGRQEGASTYWNPNGAVLKTAFHVDGKKHGPETYFRGTGEPHLVIGWDEGNPRWITTLAEGVPAQTLIGDDALEYFRKKTDQFLRGPKCSGS